MVTKWALQVLGLARFGRRWRRYPQPSFIAVANSKESHSEKTQVLLNRKGHWGGKSQHLKDSAARNLSEGTARVWFHRGWELTFGQQSTLCLGLRRQHGGWDVTMWVGNLVETLQELKLTTSLRSQRQMWSQSRAHIYWLNACRIKFMK